MGVCKTNQSTKQILVVDDNPDIRYIITNGLTEYNADWKLTEASSGKEAINELKKNCFDTILLDIMMPQIDGWDVAAFIRNSKKNKDSPIIFLTAKTDDISKIMGSHTSEKYITKPFEMENLFSTIKKILTK